MEIKISKTIEDRARELGVPVIQPLPEPRPIEINPTVAICGKCGLELKQVMGYVCSDSNCPVFPRTSI